MLKKQREVPEILLLKERQKNKIILQFKFWFLKVKGFHLFALLCLYSCAAEKTLEYSEEHSTRNKIVTVAKGELGDSYKYASSGPNSYDCSGLVKYVFTRASVSIGGSSSSMSKLSSGIDIKHARPGDLVFFAEKGKVFHVAIITASSRTKLQVIHSTSSQGVIQQEVLSSNYWQPKLYKIISLEALLN